MLGVLGACAAWTQELEMAVSPSPVGSGARAAGMADAFLAVADDATAASWNPAGLVQLERPELSIVGAYNGVIESFEADVFAGFDRSQWAHNVDLNYLSFVWPLPFLVLQRNVCVALTYQRKYDFSRGFHAQFQPHAQGGQLSSTSWRFDQQGGLGTIAPALAFEITQRLSVGAAVNLWRSSFIEENGWEQHVRWRSIGFANGAATLTSISRRERYEDVAGENVTAGLLWNVTDRWSIGARYDSALHARADYAMRQQGTVVRAPSLFNPIPAANQWLMRGNERRDLYFPQSIALGCAYRHSDRLTLSLDVTRTDWNDFYYKDRRGRKVSLVDASPLNLAFADVGNGFSLRGRPHYDPTYTVRAGAEYVFIPKQPETELDHLWTVRGGLFYDPEPSQGAPDHFYGFALGAGVQLFQRVNIDLAYQFRYGPGVNADFIRGVRGFEEDVIQNRVLLSTVVYF